MRVELRDIDADSLEDIVGTECYEAALQYVRDDAVVQQVWDDAQNALCGVVRGPRGGFHTPAEFFAARNGSRLEVSSAQCSCSARYGCEHAAALLMSATKVPAPATIDSEGGRTTSRRDTGAAWERSLDALLASGEDGTTDPAE